LAATEKQPVTGSRINHRLGEETCGKGADDPSYTVNFAVNYIETNPIVNFAENYSESAVFNQGE